MDCEYFTLEFILIYNIVLAGGSFIFGYFFNKIFK